MLRSSLRAGALCLALLVASAANEDDATALIQSFLQGQSEAAGQEIVRSEFGGGKGGDLFEAGDLTEAVTADAESNSAEQDNGKPATQLTDQQKRLNSELREKRELAARKAEYLKRKAKTEEAEKMKRLPLIEGGERMKWEQDQALQRKAQLEVDEAAKQVSAQKKQREDDALEKRRELEQEKAKRLLAYQRQQRDKEAAQRKATAEHEERQKAWDAEKARKVRLAKKAKVAVAEKRTFEKKKKANTLLRFRLRGPDGVSAMAEVTNSQRMGILAKQASEFFNIPENKVRILKKGVQIGKKADYMGSLDVKDGDTFDVIAG